MFPLGTPALPGQLLPLRVFEPRYRQLVVDGVSGTLPHDGAGRPQFGIVLITRGFEVGGGDERAGTATLVSIRSISPTGNGLNLVVGGIARLTVMEWLAEEPYPRADVEPWPDTPPDPQAAEQLAQRRAELIEQLGELRRLAVAVNPGSARLPAVPRISNDVVTAGYQLAAASPLGPADRQRVLEAPSVAARYDVLATAFEELASALRFRLG